MVNSFIHSGFVKGIIMDVRIPPHNLDAEKAVLGAFTAMRIVLFMMPS